jgi:hypothetical protein
MMDSQEGLVANDCCASHREAVVLSISFVSDVPHTPAAIVGDEHAAVFFNGHAGRTTQIESLSTTKPVRKSS